MKKKIEKGFKKEIKNIIFNIIFCSSVLGSVVLFYKNILLTTIILAILSIIALIKWKSYRTLLIFIIGGIWGPLSEIIAIKMGVWAYSESSILNIPLWLILVWGDAAAFLYQTARELKKIGVKDKLK